MKGGRRERDGGKKEREERQAGREVRGWKRDDYLGNKVLTMVVVGWP